MIGAVTLVLLTATFSTVTADVKPSYPVRSPTGNFNYYCFGFAPQGQDLPIECPDEFDSAYKIIFINGDELDDAEGMRHPEYRPAFRLIVVKNDELAGMCGITGCVKFQFHDGTTYTAPFNDCVEIGNPDTYCNFICPPLLSWDGTGEDYSYVSYDFDIDWDDWPAVYRIMVYGCILECVYPQETCNLFGIINGPAYDIPGSGFIPDPLIN